MGQRLIIEFVKDGQFKAACYLHWGGYTTSALRLVSQIDDAFASDPNSDIIWVLETLGMRPMSNPEADRNNGFYTTSQEYTEKELIPWADMFLTVDIGRLEFCAEECFSYYDEYDEYDESDDQSIIRFESETVCKLFEAKDILLEVEYSFCGTKFQFSDCEDLFEVI